MKPAIQLVIVIILAGIVTAGIIFSVYTIVKERDGLRVQVALQEDYLIGAENRENLLEEKVSEAEKTLLTLRTEIGVAQKTLYNVSQEIAALKVQIDLKDSMLVSLSTLAIHRKHKLDAAEKEIARLKDLLQKQHQNSLQDIKRRVGKEKEADRIMQQQVGSITKEIAKMKANLAPSLRPAR